MLLAAGGLLAGTLLITHWVNRREARPATATAAGERDSKPVEEPLEEGNAFGFVFRNRYLLLLAFMLLFNNWVNANGEYILGRIVKEAADAAMGAGGMHEDEFIAGFYARYFGIVNLAGMLLQLFVVSRVIKYIGVPVAICLLPAIVLGSYAMIVALPVLGVVRWVRTHSL